MPLSFFDQENRWFSVQKQCFQFFYVYFGVSKFKLKMEMRGSDAKWQKFSFLILTTSQRKYAYKSTRWDVDVTHNDYLGWPHPPLPSGPSKTVCSDIEWWRRSTFHLVCQSLGFVSDQIQWNVGKSIRYILLLIKDDIPETKYFLSDPSPIIGYACQWFTDWLSD